VAIRIEVVWRGVLSKMYYALYALEEDIAVNKSQKQKNEYGYIVVETIGAFIPFVLLVISILSLINIITVQARIHFALTQTAGTLSMYCYTLHATGLADSLMSQDARASEFGENISDVLEGISALKGGSYDFQNIGGSFDAISNMAANPKDTLLNFINFGIGELRSRASAALVYPMFSRYLTSGEMTVEQYFEKAYITNFELTDCVVLDGNENVRMTAEYEVEYTFGALRLPFAPTLRISQTVVTKAWLGGSGEGYK